MQSQPTTFLFDIHGVLLDGGSGRLFKTFLQEKAHEDERIDLSWAGDVATLMNGLLFKNCPLCEFKQCTQFSINQTPHLKQALFSGDITYEEMKVGITQMLTHFVKCPPKVRIILDYLAEFITQPEKLTKEVTPIEEGVELLHFLHKKYGPESLFILSNAHTQMFSIYQQRFPDIFSIIPRRQVILSSEVGACKPNKNIFSVIASTFNRLPAECLFFDDTAGHVQAARHEGLQAVQFALHPSEELQKIYRQLGYKE
jgi:HAD superfamily hydrolase (TIGR01509 family)